VRGRDGGYRRDHLRALAQRIEIANGEARIMGVTKRASANPCRRERHAFGGISSEFCSEVAERESAKPQST